MTADRRVPLSEYHRLPQQALSEDYYKRQLEVVCNNATLALFIMDERQQCVYMNPAAETLTGYSLAETKGRALHDVIHHTRPDGRPYPLCECPIDQAFPQNNREQGEEVFVHKDGHFYRVAYTASPIREGDQTIGTIIEVRDITQEKLDEQVRHEATQALQRSEERYRAFVQHSSEGIWRFEVDPPQSIDGSEDEQIERFYQHARLAECNQTFAQMYGLSAPEDVIGAKLADLLVPTDPHNREYLRNFIRAGYRLSDAESHEFDQHGNPKVFLNNLVGIIENGKLVRAWGTQRDITERVRIEAERQQAEAALKSKTAELQRITETAGVGLVRCSRDLRYLLVNSAYAQFAGLSVEEVVGRPLVEILGETGLETIRPYVDRVLRGERVEYESEVPFAIGKARYLHVVYTPDEDDTGNIIGWVGSITDISERKQAEQEREQLLLQAQAARERAEAANRVKDEFLAVLSHELRTPMNPILGWASLLKSGKLSAAKSSEAIATIDRNARLQVQLIDDLLDISRILRGKLVLTVEPVDLSSVIMAALETVRLAADAKNIRIQTIVPSSIAVVRGDAARLQQVVWNLLSNAVKFTPEGGQITIALTTVGTFAQIQIRDTGKGIDPEFLPYVFEHFRQEDAAITRKFGGLGLGLAIARQIVELHGGQISAQSAGAGQGATFTVQLSLAPRADNLPSLTLSSVPTSDLSGVHILVVDDEPDSRELVAFVLKEAGALVVQAASGIEALEAVKRSAFDLVVSDIGMPELDGYLLIQQIRALTQTKLPAVALTAYAGEYDQRRAIAVGFDQHLAKPIEPDTLITTLVALLHREPDSH